MARLFTSLAVFLLLALALPARAEVAVVVHRDSPLQSLTVRQVSDLFLGRIRSVGAADAVVLYEQPRDSALREEFFRLLNGMNLKQLNAYWARLQFSGEVLPPASLPDSNAVLDAVRRHRGAIGYIDAAAVDNSVRVVLRLKGRPAE